MQYYPGQSVIASDGARYTLTHWAELTWWAIRTGSGAALPLPVTPLYPCWDGDDDRAGADQARRSGAVRRRQRRPTDSIA